MATQHLIEHRSRGNFWLALALLVLGGAGYMSYQWWMTIEDMKVAIKENARIETNLSATLDAVTAAYQNEKAVADEKTDAAELALASIFPSGSEETTLTRMFDTYVSKHDYANSPLFMSSLSLGSPVTDDESGAAYVPVSLQLEGSRDNFFGFLNYVENSGALDGQVRLMDIAEVSVQVADNSDAETETDDAVQMVSFSVSVRAYFQQPLASASE